MKPFEAKPNILCYFFPSKNFSSEIFLCIPLQFGCILPTARNLFTSRLGKENEHRNRKVKNNNTNHRKLFYWIKTLTAFYPFVLFDIFISSGCAIVSFSLSCLYRMFTHLSWFKIKVCGKWWWIHYFLFIYQLSKSPA